MFKKCNNPLILRELIKGGFGVMRFQECQLCGFLPLGGKSYTDNSMMNVFSGECKSENENRVVTVKMKVKVKLNMERVALTIP